MQIFNNMSKIDVLVDLQFGDSGKGKISKWLLEKHKYNAICKYNGGPNAGHAVWINNQKYTAHMLTSGIYDENCSIVIGPGCVLDVDKFLKEIEMFSSFNIKHRVFVHPNVHIIQEKHIEEDGKDSKIGTTKQGMGPCYSDKALRTGIRAKDVEALKYFVRSPEQLSFLSNGKILMEGSQGWWLDIDNGFYPYVTSSNIHPAHAFSTFGIPLNYLRKVYGVGKVYETYSGNSLDLMTCSPEDEEKIREEGSEYGETTGRARKIGYLDLTRLVKAINQTGATYIILNKFDILEKLDIFKLIPHNVFGKRKIMTFSDSKSFKKYIEHTIMKECALVEEIVFSGDKHTV